MKLVTVTHVLEKTCCGMLLKYLWKNKKKTITFFSGLERFNLDL